MRTLLALVLGVSVIPYFMSLRAGTPYVNRRLREQLRSATALLVIEAILSLLLLAAAFATRTYAEAPLVAGLSVVLGVVIAVRLALRRGRRSVPFEIARLVLVALLVLIAFPW